jgi:glycerophosphoryl diester phosphodiesterase
MLRPIPTYLILFFILCGCSHADRRFASVPDKEEISCEANGTGCPFYIIGHRGAPYEAPENTLPSFEAAIQAGANSLEIDLLMTKDQIATVYHDRDPNELISLVRQAGLEGFPFMPSNPGLGSATRLPTELLTLEQLRQSYGYALSKGFLLDTLTSNPKIPEAIIPTLAEFKTWADDKQELKSVFLDIKLVPGQEELIRIMGDQILEQFENSQMRIFILTPYEEVYNAFVKWSVERQLPKHISLTLDFEKGGIKPVLRRIEQRVQEKVTSISMGAGLLRSWDSYGNEVRQILKDNNSEKHNSIYPIVSWTIDDEKKLYELLQWGVDGILTNRPDLLHRLLWRHWKDHSLAARTLVACFERAKAGARSEICATGSEIAPLGKIGHEEIRSWACREKGVHRRIRDLFGCGGIFDKTNISFRTKIENDPRNVIFINNQGSVEVKFLESERETSQSILLGFNQKSCSDGFLNNSCEYRFDLVFTNESGEKFEILGGTASDSFKRIFKPHFTPTHLSFTLEEMDDDESQDKIVADTALFPDKTELVLNSPNKTFSGTLSISQHNSDSSTEKKLRYNSSMLEFHQSRCDDGFMNNSCEYRLEVKLFDSKNEEVGSLVHEGTLKDSFIVFLNLDKRATRMLVRLRETDEGETSEQVELEMKIKHGVISEVVTSEGTFAGQLKLKFFDYDESREHSEGIEGFNPHQQQYRQFKHLEKLDY